MSLTAWLESSSQKRKENKPKPSDISCQATADPDGDKLYCTISNIYSSRGIYTCQASREKDEEHSQVERLNMVNMATLNDEGGRTVSGRCNITTKLPEEAGNYSYRVQISPGGLVVQAKLPDVREWIEHCEENSASSGGHISRTGLIVVWISLFML